MPEAQQAGQKTLIVIYIRILGAVFMLAAVTVAFNLGGLAGTIGITDGLARKILGGFLFALGLADYFVLPAILTKIFNKQN